ncbi:MAG: dihydrolipoamide acetyltransferase family protein, partial [Bacteroidota bacterium]
MSQVEFKMPRLGESITEAAIIKWFKNVGDTIEVDEILLEVATDKVDAEVPSTLNGEIVELRFQPNDVVTIGQVIAVINTTGEQPVQKEAKEQPTAKPEKEIARPKPSRKRAPVTAQSFEVNKDIFVSPLVDSIAREHHISYEELARIPATGDQGRLRKSDVMAYLKDGRPFQFVQPQAEPSGFRVPDLTFDKGTGERVEMDRMRQMIADRMVFSKHTSPHVTAYVEADLTAMVSWRNEHKAAFQKKYQQKLTFTPLFIEAIASAIKAYPMINSSLDGSTIIVKDHINIGMATALPTGNLIVPVVKDADKKDLKALAETTNELAAKARNGELSGDDIKGSTFTISNVGTFGSLMGTPIINQPEAAILATGIIKKRAEVIEKPEGDTIEIRSMMYLS